MLRKSLLHLITFIILIALNKVDASYIYQPMIAALKRADLVVMARVVEIRQEGMEKWCEDSTLRLRVRERPDTGIWSSADYEILYEPETTYLLFLATKDDALDLAHYPWISQIAINENNESMVKDIKAMISINSMANQSTKALRYTQLFESPHVMIRESVAWELGRIECPEALTGLIVALKDSAHWVLSNTLAGFYSLGKNGISSPEAAAELDHIAIYSYSMNSILEALAAQKGEVAIPLLHNLFSYPDGPKEPALKHLPFWKTPLQHRCFVKQFSLMNHTI